jgi:hypothetical protein
VIGMLVRDILYASPQIFSDEGLKKYRMVFRAGLRDPCTRDVARLFGNRRNTRAAVECIFTHSESRATAQVHGSCYPVLGKPFGNCFIK